MNPDLDLTAIDPSGSVAEAEDAIDGETRADFFKKAGLLGGSAFAASMLAGVVPALAASPTPAKKGKTQDVAILNYALTLEYLESSFYNLAVKNAGLSGDVASATKVVQAHENTHVAYLKKALGTKAIKKPTFDFKGATDDAAKFLATAVVLEDTGVSAYSGQALNIFSPKVVTAAISILTVEARHASAFRLLAKKTFAPKAFDKAASEATVLKAAGGFIKK